MRPVWAGSSSDVECRLCTRGLTVGSARLLKGPFSGARNSGESGCPNMTASVRSKYGVGPNQAKCAACFRCQHATASLYPLYSSSTKGNADIAADFFYEEVIAFNNVQMPAFKSVIPTVPTVQHMS